MSSSDVDSELADGHSPKRLATAFAHNFAYQLMGRFGSFAINLYLLRVVQVEVLGLANVRLTLLYTTILFLVREPFRKACLSADDAANMEVPQRRQSLINLLWLCVPLSLVIATFLTAIWLFLLSRPENDELSSCYGKAVYYFVLSALIEVLSEPLWIVAQHFYLVKFVAFTQGMHVLLQRVVVAALVTLWPQDNASALMAFAYAQVKQVLTDGAGYVMTFLDVVTFAEQGIFDTIDRIGSLIARILLAPLEESAHVYFSKTIERGKSAREQNQRKLTTAVSVLYGLLRCTSILGVTVVTFGSSYAFLVLRLYGGTALATRQGCSILRTYCVYVLLLALNGITECFATASMTRRQVGKHQKALIILGVVHLMGHTVLSLWLGPVGFVLANGINMLLRVVYSLKHITNFLESHKNPEAKTSETEHTVPQPNAINQLIPNIYTGGSLIFAFIFTTLSNLIFCCDGVFMTLAHFCVGIVFLGATLVVVFTTDFEMVIFAERFVWHSKRE